MGRLGGAVRRKFLILATLIAAQMAYGQIQEPCPPCYNNNRILPGHGYTQDGRVRLNVYFEPQGWSTTEVAARAQRASACASNMWHRARGTNINDTIPYSLESTTDSTSADIVVQRD